MNILFVMEHRVNAGNTHAVANYIRVAEELGHTIAFFGPHHAGMAAAKFSTDPRAFDRVIYLIESKLYRVSRLQEVAMLATVPRARTMGARRRCQVQSGDRGGRIRQELPERG